MFLYWEYDKKKALNRIWKSCNTYGQAIFYCHTDTEYHNYIAWLYWDNSDSNCITEITKTALSYPREASQMCSV